MNISDAKINLNISANNSANIKNNGVNVPSNGTVTANAQISTVKEGQIFNGQILDITNDKVSIMLDNSKTLYAQMIDAVNMNIGDSLTFLVKENNGFNVLIKPYGNNVQSMKDNTIFKILDTNSISPTEKNYQIAESLMNNNMPVDKSSMQRIMQQSYKYPEASLDTLINLNKLGIPVNETNIAQYESYMSNNHQLTQDISNLGNSIVEFNLSAINDVINLAGETSDNKMQQLVSINTNMLSAISDNSDMSNINLAELLNSVVLDGDESGTTNKVITDINPDSNIQNLDLSNNIESLSNKIFVDKSTIEGLFKELSNAGVKDVVIQNIIDKSETPMQLLNNINEVITNADKLGIDLDSIKELLLSDSYNKALTEAIKDKFSLNPKEMDNPKELDDLYKSMYEKTNKLIEAFSSGTNSQAEENMSNAAKSMQQRIDFMQNLNNMYAYAQIPVKLDQNQMNSDLFVYMNKRNLNNQKEEVSALLHLDMEHLGATDVHVSLHGNNVHTRFYVEDEVSARIIDQHMTMLEQAINDNGFNLTNEVITREPTLATSSNMVVKEMLGEDLEQSVKRYSFDVRM